MKKKLAVLIAAFVLGCLAVEAGVRWLVFGESELARSWGESWRHPWRFADRYSEEDYWKLSQLLQREPGPVPEHIRHPDLGWVAEAIDSVSLAHRDAPSLGARRPILLFGDSYAQCNTPPWECFQSLLDGTELGEQYRILNYGVRGYGLDQVLLLMRAVLGEWAPSRPVVIVAVCVEEVFERSALGFRGWPKPRFRLEHGELALEGTPVPALDAWMEAHPLDIPSYAWRALRHRSLGSDDLAQPAGDEAEAVAAKQELNRAILAAMHALCGELQLEHFLVVFHSLPYFTSVDALDWREAFPAEAAADIGMHWVSSKPILLEDALLSARSIQAYFGADGHERDHFGALGNEVALRAIVQGLRSEFGTAREHGAPHARDFRMVEGLESGLISAAWSAGRRAPFTDADGDERICMRLCGPRGTRIAWVVDGRARRFRASLRGLPHSGAGTACCPVRVAAWVDDRLAFERDIDHASAARDVAVDLSGAKTFSIRLSSKPGNTADVVCLCEPRFEP